MTASDQSRHNNREAGARALARSFLDRSVGFKECSPQTLDALVAAGILRQLAKGEYLARRGEQLDALCLLLEGALESGQQSSDGRRSLVAVMPPGELAGLISLIDGLGFINDLHVRGKKALVLMIPGEVIRRLRVDNPCLGRAFELQLAFRTRLLLQGLVPDPSLPLPARLARLLRILASVHGLTRPEGLLLDLRISQSDLGAWLGVSRQRANFAVQELEKEGLIARPSSRILILDAPGLQARATP